MAIRDMPISPGFKTSLRVLKILGLSSRLPTEFIMPFFYIVTKNGILRGNIGLKGHFLLLNGPKGGLDFFIVCEGWLG